jgi:hypothetical protein
MDSMKTACFSETVTSANQSTQQYNPKEHHQNQHCHENFNLSLRFGFEDIIIVVLIKLR